MNQKVKIAYLQTPVTLPGVFTSMTTIDNIKVPGSKVTLTDNGGILIDVKGLTAYVPAANVKLALLDIKEDNETVRKAKS